MELSLIVNLIVCVCALAGFIYGVHIYFKPRQPLYLQMVTIALGCASLGRLYHAAVLVCDGDIPRTFNTGVLAVIGCFLFFFSANYGQMDSLCDMEDQRNQKVRLLALIVPVILLSAAVFVLLAKNEGFVYRISAAAEIFVIMLASYYNSKHLMIHDVEAGILGSIRGYNLLALLLEVLYTAEIVLDTNNLLILKSIVLVIMSAVFLLLMPVLRKGGKKWKV